jgi:O-acetyl-ADP-ribose deacetylase (regulator of RNase III)
MKVYYLVTRPETITSITIVGRLPDNLPSWIPTKEIQLFETIQKSILTTSTNLRQTFVLELNLPEISDTHLLTYAYTYTADRETFICAKQVDPTWIKRIYVCSKASENLVNRIFNNNCPKEICVQSEFFIESMVQEEKKIEDSSLKLKNPSPIVYFKRGDLLGSRMQTLINTVNCVGIMGKGIAFAFKQRYPEMFEDYKKRCQLREVQLGKPYLYKVNEQRWIINFPTKNHWKQKSQLQDIEVGLKYLAERAFAWGITSLAVPPLGCGNGGLNWDHVQPLIEKYLSPLNIPLEVYCPFTKRIDRIDHSSSRKRTAQTAGFPNLNSFFKPNNGEKAQSFPQNEIDKTDINVTPFIP